MATYKPTITPEELKRAQDEWAQTYHPGINWKSLAGHTAAVFGGAAAAPGIAGALGVGGAAGAAGAAGGAASAAPAVAAGTGATAGAGSAFGAAGIGGAGLKGFLKDPTTLSTIGGVVANLFNAKGAKSRADAEEALNHQKYDDDVQQWLAQQAAIEQDRQHKISLYAAFAKSQGLDNLFTPSLMAALATPKPVVQPPPYRASGTPGFGWDLAGIALQGAASIYGANKASKINLADIVRKARLGTQKPPYLPAGLNPPSLPPSFDEWG